MKTRILLVIDGQKHRLRALPDSQQALRSTLLQIKPQLIDTDQQEPLIFPLFTSKLSDKFQIQVVFGQQPNITHIFKDHQYEKIIQMLKSKQLPARPKLKLISSIGPKSIPPNQKFMWTLKLQNQGQQKWPEGACFMNLQNNDTWPIESLLPGEIKQIDLQYKSGCEQGQQRTLQNGLKMFFGQKIMHMITTKKPIEFIKVSTIMCQNVNRRQPK